jgi:hypothetical protein
MTPNGIEILIHCHCCPAPHPRIDAPAVREEIRSFLANGLVEASPELGPDIYTTTGRGKAHIAQLCNTAWPRQGWVTERGDVIDMN